jgi:hypothetical protein
MLGSRKLVAGAFAGAALFVMTAAAQAATLTTGNIQVNLGGGDTEVSIFLVDANGVTSGSGKLGSNAGLPGMPTVSFTDISIPSDFSNGNATIKGTAQHSVITSLTFSVPTGFFFTDALFRTQGSSTIKIEAFNGGSSVGVFTADGADVPNGATPWLTVAINSALLTAITVSTTGDGDGFTQLKDFSLSGILSCGPQGSGCAPVPVNGVPLPATLPLFAAGAGLLGFVGWRRKKKMA